MTYVSTSCCRCGIKYCIKYVSNLSSAHRGQTCHDWQMEGSRTKRFLKVLNQDHILTKSKHP